jgi:hypothetical protein
MIVVPDKIGTEIGWRGWQVAVRRNRAVLYSVIHKVPWPAGKAIEAFCRKSHAAPAGRCTCGLYAARSLEHLREIAYHTHGVLGEVHLWGTVIPGQLGWRAQYAYPKCLYVPHESYRLVAPLKASYGVPVKLINPYNPGAVQ